MAILLLLLLQVGKLIAGSHRAYTAYYTALRAKYAELFIGESKCLHEFLSHHPILVAKFLTECKATRIRK